MQTETSKPETTIVKPNGQTNQHPPKPPSKPQLELEPSKPQPTTAETGAKVNQKTLKPENRTKPNTPNLAHPSSCETESKPTTINTHQKPATITKFKPPETKQNMKSKPNVKTRTVAKGVSDLESLKEFLARKKLDREQKQKQAKSVGAQASPHTAGPGSQHYVQNRETASRLACGDIRGNTKPSEIIQELNRRGK